MAAALKLLIINSPKGPTLILYSHKALMQGKVGANGTLGKANQQGGVGGDSQMQMQWWTGRKMTDTLTDRQTRGGGKRINMKISQCGLWGTSKRLLKAWQGCTPKQAGTLDVMAHRQWDGAAASSPQSMVRQTLGGAQTGWTYPLIFWGRLFWNSISSTVHTAPFTFSTRTKHLWRLRLCRTAFCSWCEDKERKQRSLSVQQTLKKYTFTGTGWTQQINKNVIVSKWSLSFKWLNT